MRKKLLGTLLSLCLVITAIPFTGISVFGAAGDTTSGLAAHWNFDGNTTETVSGIPLEATDVEFAEGVLGKAAVFNGSSSFIETEATDKLLFDKSFTVSLWAYNGDKGDASGTYVYMGRDCGWDYNENEFFSSPYKVFLRDGSIVQTHLSDIYGTADIAVNNNNCQWDGKSVDGNQWQLITVTYDGKKIKLYRNKTLLGQYNYDKGITNKNPYGLLIGADETFEDYFTGMMDDLRLYSRALTNDDISALYEKGISASKELLTPSKKLVANYKFEKNAKDSSKLKNHGETMEVEGTTKFVKAKKGYGIKITDGNYVEVPASDSLNFSDGVTFAYWLKASSEGDYPIIVRQNPCMGQYNENDAAYKITFSGWNKTNISTTLRVGLYSSSSWTMSNFMDAEIFKTGSVKKWHHYAITIGKSNGKLVAKTYFDGKLTKSKSSSKVTDISNASGSLLIGFDGEEFLDGVLDELQIYNYALTATQIKKLAK